MGKTNEGDFIPSVREVRRRLAEVTEAGRLLRKQLKVSEEAAAEERRKAELGITRFRRTGETTS
jgi:hypothetical protein